MDSRDISKRIKLTKDNIKNEDRKKEIKEGIKECNSIEERFKLGKTKVSKYKTGIGKTGQGIPLDKVKSNVINQIYPDENGAYGYLPKEGTAYDKPEYDFKDVDWAEKRQKIRKEYIEQSKDLENDIGRMKSEGIAKESIASHVVKIRNEQKVSSRSKMPIKERASLEERNIKKFGNPIGPNPEDMFIKIKKDLIKNKMYQSNDQIWDMIIEKAIKKDDVINTLLGLLY